ncbi:MAG: T9SS type A sorting domain-containing protein [Bacteroidota bacterium]
MKKSILLSLVLSAAVIGFTLFKIVDINPDISISESKIKVRDAKYSSWSEHKKFVKGVLKSDDPDKYTEYHKMIRVREGEDKPGYKPNYKLEALQKARVNMQKGNSTKALLDWKERGPANVGGRTRGIIVDPDDALKNTWFAGSVGGGVWKTSDAGASWRHLTEGLPNLATTVLVMANTNHNIIFCGTGEGFGNVDGVMGDGIFKSTDRGETWTQIASTAGDPAFAFVNRIVVDPADENIVIAATNSGVYKSVDGGTSWVRKYTSSVQDLRVNALNFKTIYAGKSGGVIKSTDAGETWSDKLSSDFVGNRYEIAVSPTDTSRVYASVDASTSLLYMTTDAGLTWNEVIEQAFEHDDENAWLGGQGWYDNTIEVHPYDAGVVFMGGIDVWKAEVIFGTKRGISNIVETNIDSFMTYTPKGLPFKDGGVGTGEDFWLEKVFEENDLVDVEIRFGLGRKQKAHRFTLNTHVYQDYIEVPFEVWDVKNNKQLMVSFLDIQKNKNFNLITSQGDVIYVNGVEYDSSASNPNIAVDNGQKYKNLFVAAFRSKLGVTWNPANHPDAKLRIEVGDIPVMFRETTPVTNGYSRYTLGAKNVHVDHHNIVMIPVNEATKSFRILNGNDGGLAISDDGGATFVEVGDNGYNTTQFYGADKMPGGDAYFGGTQDNGTFMSPVNASADETTSYTHVLGGDGFEVAWSYGDAGKMIGGSQYNRFYRVVDGDWNKREAASVGFEEGWGSSTNSPFISKIASSKSDPELLFTVTKLGAFRSDNFAAEWTLSPIPAADFHNGAYFSQAQVAISVADPQVVWVAAYMSSNGKVHVSKDGGISFKSTNNFTDVTMGRVSGFDTHPINAATAYALFSFSEAPKILRTTDYGNSWKDISGYGTGTVSTTGFPDVAVYGLVVMPYNTNIIWVGTEIGLVESVDGGATWHLADNGFPAVSIWEMKIVDDQVVVATHGRGIFSVTLPELADYNPPKVVFPPRLNVAGQTPSGIAINATLRDVYDSTVVFLDDIPIKSLFVNTTKDTSIVIPVTSLGTKKIGLISYKDGRAYKSVSKNIEIYALLPVQLGYANNFENPADDLILAGFDVAKPAGFNNNCLNTPHPYLDQSSLTAVLKVPIVVAADNANFSYDDIALIEPGEPGTKFGDSEFWDYVIVEGAGGGDWIPLLDGYDARFDAAWEAAYNNNTAGSAAMFKNHTINLLDFFSAGDTVLVRFRLFADQYTTGWGWAIDNIVIQGQFVGVDDETVPTNYRLAQNYPNPFNPSTTISYSIPKSSHVTVNIYNSLGELVTKLVNKEQNVGSYKMNWNAVNMASGVYYYRIEAGDFVEVKKMLLVK